ncbi:hypothetical protein AMK59_1137 [Oryctes borbonicus]|uniref:Uncharacterized protein n=1 Tax=Oryctes borbonicus TaxID=1629725 RepID=A0A0T6BGF3_9SCAR|nr:hypothetical protein AMK59_1137 [Oryctes borbonicus]
MDNVNVYDDVHVDLGNEISKLEEQNKYLLNHINKLEDDVKKLCTELVNMKEIQKNLSRNISELFKTAKIEIQRKDRTIAELRQEIDDLILNKGGNFKRFKRQLHEKEADDHTKRFKSNVYDNEHKSARENSPAKLTSTSTSDSNRSEVRDATQYEDANKTIRDYKTNHFNRNSRYPLSTSNSRYQRRDTWYNENRRGRNRSRRSRSFDRSHSKDKYRSRSGDKYNNSITRPRWKESKTPECRTYNDRISKSVERRYEYSERSPFRRDRDLYYNEDNVSNLTKGNLNAAHLDIINLDDDDIEDGEITAESDALIIEDYNVEPKSLDPQQSNILTNRVDTKPITIEEYRNRRKDVEGEPRVIESKVVNDKEVDERAEKNSSNANNKELETQKEPEKTESIAVVTLDISSNINNHIKTTDCDKSIAGDINKSDAVLNNSSNNAINLNNEGSNSINLDNCNISCGDNSNLSNSSNLSITPNNSSRRPRKRRCVVIGFKEKT